MTAATRRALRRLLTDALPWLVDTNVGPTTVDAGLCSACGNGPSVVAVCGPVPFQTVCATCCVQSLASELFCAGHLDEGRYARNYCQALPANWAQCVLLWWIATGEIACPSQLQVDALFEQPGAQRVSVDELVRSNAKLLSAGDVFFPIIDE